MYVLAILGIVFAYLAIEKLFDYLDVKIENKKEEGKYYKLKQKYIKKNKNRINEIEEEDDEDEDDE